MLKMYANKISLAIFGIRLILSLDQHSYGSFKDTAGIAVSHVRYGLKAYFTYDLYHQNNSIGLSFVTLLVQKYQNVVAN